MIRIDIGVSNQSSAPQWIPILVPLIGALVVGLISAAALVWNSNRQRAMDRNLAMLDRRIDAGAKIGDLMRDVHRDIVQAKSAWDDFLFTFALPLRDAALIDLISAVPKLEERIGKVSKSTRPASGRCAELQLALAKLNLLLSADSFPARIGTEALNAYWEDINVIWDRVGRLVTLRFHLQAVDHKPEPERADSLALIAETVGTLFSLDTLYRPEDFERRDFAVEFEAALGAALNDRTTI